MGNSEKMTANSLRKLLKLQRVRVRSKEKQLESSKNNYQVAHAKYVKRTQELVRLKDDFKQLVEYLKQQAVCASPIKREYAYSRRFWLNYDLEMHEYYLQQEKDELEEASKVYQNSKDAWYKERLRTQQLESKYEYHNKRNIQNEDNIVDEAIQDDLVITRMFNYG